jgi:non-heme chloroperoxidase
MKYITSKDLRTGEDVRISYNSYGSGKPVVLIHGWPSSKEMWEYQLEDLVNAGFQVVKYDRRGFGKSDKPWSGYDYDSFAADLNTIMEELDLRDATLVGFSMGGGEVARYIGKYGTARVSKAVLVAAVTPYLGEAGDNPDGVPRKVFSDMQENIRKDRIGFLDDFGKMFFGVNLIKHPLSAPLLEHYRNLASVASQRATLECVTAFGFTDFRSDLEALKNIPTLIIHGDSDKIVPMEASAERTVQILPSAQYLVYAGAPHGLFYTHREQLNKDLVAFINS